MIVTITIVIILAISYLIIYFSQRTAVRRAAELQTVKKEIESYQIDDQLRKGRSMTLSGRSLKKYQKLESDYNDIVNSRFLRIDQCVNEVTYEARGINYMRTRKALAELEKLTQAAGEKAVEIKEGLTDLTRVNQEHQDAIEVLQNKYEDLRKELLADSLRYGPAGPTLEKKLAELEKTFEDEFMRLTKEGDHESANDVYEQLRVETDSLEKMMFDIPDLYSKLSQRYPEQIQELTDGAKQLQKDGFVFEASPEQAIQHINGERETTLAKLGELKTKEVTDDLVYIEKQIDDLYTLMENEMTSRDKSENSAEQLDSAIDRLGKANDELALTLDQLGQKFVFKHRELEEAHNYEERIKQLDDAAKQIDKKHRDKEIAFSTLNTRQNELLDQTKKIYDDQKKFYQQVSGYDGQLFQAKKAYASMTQQFEEMVRSLNMKGLPGIPAAYQNQYRRTKRELDKLSDQLDRSLIDLDSTMAQASMARTELVNFTDQSNKVFNEYELSTWLMQRARSYINDTRMVRAYEAGQVLYGQKHNYEETLRIVGGAMNEINPGEWQQMQEQFNRNRIPLFTLHES